MSERGRAATGQISELFRGRRPRADEVAAWARGRAGVELVAGFDRLVRGGSVSYGGRGPIMAWTHLTDAHLLRLTDGTEVVWETGEVAHDLGDRHVVFPFRGRWGTARRCRNRAGPARSTSTTDAWSGSR